LPCSQAAIASVNAKEHYPKPSSFKLPDRWVLFLIRSFWALLEGSGRLLAAPEHSWELLVTSGSIWSIPGCSWALLVMSGSFWSTSGCGLASWALLEASGPLLASFGHSWALLDASWKAPVLDRAQNKPNFLSKVLSGGYFWSLGLGLGFGV